LNPESDSRLDVARVLLAALVAPILHKRLILWFAVPLITMRLAAYIVDTVAVDGIAFSLISLIPILLLTVACHRIFILGESSMARYGMVWWTLRETRFFLWMLGIGLVAGVVALPAVMIVAPFLLENPSPWAYLALFGLSLPAIYIFSRLSLVLPAAATDDGAPTFAGAWDLSQGNGVRLTVAVGVLPFLLDGLLGLLPPLDSLVFEVLFTFVWLYILIVEVAALSMSYRELKRIRSGTTARA